MEQEERRCRRRRIKEAERERNRAGKIRKEKGERRVQDRENKIEKNWKE